MHIGATSSLLLTLPLRTSTIGELLIFLSAEINACGFLVKRADFASA